MDSAYRISEVARQLGVTPQYLRILEWDGLVPPVHRDFNGRLYSDFDIALLRNMGVGTRPRKLKRPEEALAGGR